MRYNNENTDTNRTHGLTAFIMSETKYAQRGTYDSITDHGG